VRRAGLHADRAEVLALVRALEADSTHPFGRALLAFAGAGDPAAIEGRRFVAGKGVEARDARGRRLFLGRGDGSACVLERDGAPLAVFELHEELRPEAAEAVAALHAAGLRVVVLSGDDASRVGAAAAALGVEAHARLAPEDKHGWLAALGPGTTMVGDGVNDAPALAGRLTSIAVDGGAPIAKGLAQVALTRADLRLVPWTIAHARDGLRLVRRLLGAATAYNLVFVALAAAGALRPVWAGLSMLLSSLLSIGFAARIGAAEASEGAGAVAEATP
jgi:cation transport ATPase